MEGSSLKRRRAVSGGGELSQVEESLVDENNCWWRGLLSEGDSSLCWMSMDRLQNLIIFSNFEKHFY